VRGENDFGFGIFVMYDLRFVMYDLQFTIDHLRLTIDGQMLCFQNKCE